jgi:hypothetical protein
VESK